MKKYRFKVADLDCANCAREVEEHLNKDKHIKNCTVNFSKLSISFETDIEDNVLKYVETKAKEAEPEIRILSNDEEDSKNEIKLDIIKVIVAILLAIVAHFTNEIINPYIYIVAYIILLYEIFIKACKLLIKSHIVNENLLITISCIGAFIIGERFDGLMVIILYSIGEILEHLAVNNSRKSISELMDIKPEYANLKINEEIKQVNPSEVNINDIIVVKKGEKIPLDGIVIKGTTKLNTSALTGESKLLSVKGNDEVLSGSINEGNIFEIKVTKKYEDSTVSKILDLVENASDRKAATENFVSRAAKIYTPIVIILALLVGFLLPIVFKVPVEESIYRALTFLVVSCPCAIAISVPLSYFSGIGAASKKGILIKGSDYLDSIRNIKQIIFDKTGTITTGEFSDYKLEVINDKYKEKDIINYYLLGESFSTHPIAKSILKIFDKKVNTSKVEEYKEISGKGLSYKLDKDIIQIGSSKLVGNKEKDSYIYLKINDEIVAKLELIDGIKPTSKNTIATLNKMGIKTLMFTGDAKEIALEIAGKVGVKETKYELLPKDKYNLLKNEIDNCKEGKIAFIGDGINDAPSIRLADVGISMGNIGSSSAIEASDVVITNDDLAKLIEAIDLSKFTNKIIVENLIFAIGVKVIVLLLSSFGLANMAAAVFADTGVTLLAIINTTRILKRK